MKKTYSILAIILFLSIQVEVLAQNVNAQRKSRFIEDVRFGGGFGLSFGNDFFSGTLAPFALYEFSPYFMGGAGLNTTYSRFGDNSTFVYGGSIIGIARPVNELQLSAEFEQLRVNRSFNDGDFEDNYWYPALFLGLGYSSGPVTFGVRYDVLYDENRSIYASAYMPFVRVLF